MSTLPFTKLPSDQRLTIWHSPSGGSTLGITNVYEPLAAEINNTGGTSGMLNASPSISYNDLDFGLQASETLNEPSLADAGSYVEFGQSNYGGGISYYLPQEWDDNSDNHSLIFDLTSEIDSKIDVVTRLDGDLKTTVAAADGQFVSVFRVEGGADANPFTPGESKRHTRSWFQKSDFSHYTVVGDHAITAIEPAAYEEGDTGRIRASQGGRDVTNSLVFSTSDSGVIEVYPGGFFEITGAEEDTATVTITDPGTGDTESVAVEITAPPWPVRSEAEAPGSKSSRGFRFGRIEVTDTPESAKHARYYPPPKRRRALRG